MSTLDQLLPLPYQKSVVALLKEREPELWRWGSSAEAENEYVQQVRTGLLKGSYRLGADGHAELIARCAAVAARLGITVPITLYQSLGSGEMNAGLYFLPGEAHVVFSGAVLNTLQGAEVDAVLAHELAHYRLWEQDGGDFLVADRLLMAAAHDSRAAISHAQTARRLRLYTEIYADRGGLVGCGQLEPAVAALVKMATGLPQVSAASYLRQADEILADGKAASEGVDHPEIFIRARALRLWSEGDPGLDAWLGQVIEGELAIDELDLVSQGRMLELTRRVLAQFLRPAWFRTDAVLAHARNFFPGFTPATADDPALSTDVALKDGATLDYLCYLLLDFTRVDRDLDTVPLAHGYCTAEALGLAERFSKLAGKELGLGKRELTRLKKDAATLVARAGAAP